MVDTTGSVNLLDLPTQLASALGIDSFSAGILISLVIALICVLAVLIISKGKAISAALIVGIAAAGFCTSIGWFPVWTMIIICVLTAVGAAQKIKEML